MCGIAGIVGEPSPRQLEHMTDKIRHRGPDGSGMVVMPRVGFAHRLLRIVGECPQPVEQDGCLLTYNGEIYGIPGSLSDTARLIPLYRRYGFPEMLDHLNGMFAFALYDERRGVVHLARDRFGEKPLYYTWTRRGFEFASEIKALDRGAVNPRALIEHSRYLSSLGRSTFYCNVYKLEPGSWLTVADDGTLRAQGRYWDLPEVSVDPAPEDMDELRDLIEDAVHIRTRADWPVGTYVSGGLDSSLITCLARPDKAFNGDFRESGYSEFDYALMAARAAGAFLENVCITLDDLDAVLDRVMYHLDEPAAGVGSLPQYLVAQLAAERGYRVMLSGQGADEVFAGYGRYADLAGIPRPVGYENYVAPEQYHSLTLDEAQRWDVRNFLPALLHVEDRVNMAHGIEARAPFLDHRIAEFMFSRPAEWRVQGGLLKGALRKVARGIVPDPIIDRADKQGFPVPGQSRDTWRERSLAAWRRVSEPMREAA